MAELERRLAAAPEPVRAPDPAAPADPAEESGPPPPGDAEEAAFLAEAGARNGDAATIPELPPAGDAPVPAAPEAPLPALDGLVERIPAAVRSTLDELFRARFTDVRRAREKDLRASI